MSPWASQAISNINNEQAPYQQRRAFNKKLYGALIQTGLTGIGGIANAIDSDVKQRSQAIDVKNKAIADAIRNAKLPPSHPDDTPRDEYGLEVARPSYDSAMDAAAVSGRQAPLHDKSFLTPDTRQLAKDISASNDANDAATAAPIAGRWTSRGFDDADMNASVNASDIDRAKAMMRQAGQQQSFGGLGNSFNGGR